MKIRDWPMERKIGMGTLGIALAAIILISTFLILSEQKTIHGTRVNLTRTLVGMIANNAAAALVYNDDEVARQILSGIKAEPSATVAALYDADGNLYVWFPTKVPRSALPINIMGSEMKESDTSFDVSESVMIDGKSVGTAFLRTDLLESRHRFKIYVFTVAVAALSSILFALLLSGWVQRWISEPLRSLSQTAKRIAAERDYSIRATRLSNDEVGELVEAFNFMVQEIEQSHEEIKRHTANLEALVAERTAKLTETVSELETFSYSVSHDMRGPLRAISGYSEVVLERLPSDDTESRQYLERMIRASHRMDLLVCDILNYSRVVKSEMPIEVVNLDDLIADVLVEYPQFAGADFEIRNPLGTVLGHRAALTQVVSNLLGNAIKFVPPGRKPTVRIFSETFPTTHRLRIADNGIGIRAEDLPRLFRVFERVGDVRNYAGTGIGLSIVKKALEKMNGQVGVESRVGEGSTFWFELSKAKQRET